MQMQHRFGPCLHARCIWLPRLQLPEKNNLYHNRGRVFDNSHQNFHGFNVVKFDIIDVSVVDLDDCDNNDHSVLKYIYKDNGSLCWDTPLPM